MVETPKSSNINAIHHYCYHNQHHNHHETTVNPFEETNRFRLEQSILSPNLFNATNLLTTPEKDTNSIWNIDQRAILFPADIPTDEKSLIAQSIHDSNFCKQVSAAVETFWSQNKTVIESPAPSSASSLYKEKLFTTTTTSTTTSATAKATEIQFALNEIHETTFINKATKDQTCQTVLSFPFDLDLDKIAALKNFLIESPVRKKKATKAASIRKQLFSSQITDESDNDELHHYHRYKQHHSPSISPNSLDSIDWNEAKYQERFSSSPKLKFINLNELEVCSTPELSPHVKKLDEQQLFKFDTKNNNLDVDCNDYSCETRVAVEEDTNKHGSNNNNSSNNDDATQTLNNYLDIRLNRNRNHHRKDTANHHDILINSPNLSPIKELSSLMVDENSNNKENELSMSRSSHKNKQKQQHQVIDMDIDIGGGILKASRIVNNSEQQETSKNNIENFSFITNIADNSTTTTTTTRKYTRELSSEMFNSQVDIMNTSRPFAVTNVFDEMTGNQDQDTGYQTGGSTQFNMMDLTSQESVNNFTAPAQKELVYVKLPEIQEPPLVEGSSSSTSVTSKLQHPSSLNFDSFKSSYKRVNSFSKETPTLNLPSFAGLCPLGSSTPEKSKPYFHLNESYNNDTDYLSVTNGLNTNTLYKHNSTFNNNNPNQSHNNNKVGNFVKTELESSFMEQSLLNSKLSPSEYARTLIQKAMQDLNDSKNFKF